MEESGCAVVLDIENLFYGATDDRLLQEKRGDWQAIAKTLVPYIKQFAKRQAPIKILYGAMSVSPYSRRSTLKTISQMTGYGFEMTVVAFGPNAADRAIAEQCKVLAGNPNISHVVLATGDGQEPFPSIIKNLLGQKKKVSLIVYDQIPARFSNREDISVFQLAPAIRLGKQENTDDAMAVHCDMLEKTEITAPNTVPNPKTAYRKAVKAMLEGETYSEEEHRKKIASATFALLRGDFDRPYRMGQLITLLSQSLPQEGILISDDEIAALIHTLINFTDLFQKKEIYTLNAQSSFRQTLTR